MSDETTSTATLERDETPAQGTTETANPDKQRFGDRLWGWKAMLAVALAAVILGGLAGAGIALAAGGDSQNGRFGPGGRGGPGTGQGPGPGFGPGQNGQQGRGFGQQNGQQDGQQNQQGSGTSSTT